MIMLNIFNMNEFLNVVNRCTGPVNLLSPDGTVTDIRQNSTVQENLMRLHQAGGKSSRIPLDIPEKADYMNIVFFTIGDC